MEHQPGGGVGTFSPAQLARIRHALSEPTCMIMYMFIDPLRLTWNYTRPAGENDSLRAAQKTAGDGPGNQWKRMFMAQIRQNRDKDDLLHLTANETQNAVVRHAVNNWLSSTSHIKNQRWELARRAGGWEDGNLVARRQGDQQAHEAERVSQGEGPGKITQETEEATPWGTGWGRLFDSDS